VESKHGLCGLIIITPPISAEGNSSEKFIGFESVVAVKTADGLENKNLLSFPAGRKIKCSYETRKLLCSSFQFFFLG